MKCIYLKKDSSEATFNSAEHIIPKSIGGISCLEKGMVSDEINNEFSKIEMHFSRENTNVALRKMFNINIGRKKHKNREKVIATISDDGEIALGYLKNGKTYYINQIEIKNLRNFDNNKVPTLRMIFQNTENLTETFTEDFINDLQSYKGDAVQVKSNHIPTDVCYLGIKDKRWYMAFSNLEDSEEIEKYIKMLKPQFLKLEQNNISSPILNKSPATLEITFNMDLKTIYRVYAKMAFNALAYLYGSEFVLKSEFDEIRNAIVEGVDIMEYVHYTNIRNVLRDTLYTYDEHLCIGDQAHYIYFMKENDAVYGIINLFGTNNSIRVKLCSYINCDNIFNGYICDWENKRDFTLLEFITELYNQEELSTT